VSDLPLYEEAGRRVMTDEELAEALEAFKRDYPGQATYAGIEARLRRLNDEAKDAALAEQAGTTVDALRRAREEQAEARRRARDRDDLVAARRAVAPGDPASPPVAGTARRTRGRSRWSEALFAARWVAACERAGEPYSYVHVAPAFEWMDGTQRIDADPEYLGRLWRKWGTPDPHP